MTQNGSETRIASLKKADAILEIVREADGATVTELSNRLDAPKSTVCHYLATLRECNYLVKEGSTYRIGLKFLSLGAHARNRNQIYLTGKSEVDKLANNINGVAQLVIEEGGDGVYAYQSGVDSVESIDTSIGTRVNLHCSAAGKALLAHKSDDDIEAWLGDNDLTRYTENTITTPERLREEVAQVRAEEVAYDDEEQFRGTRCVAAPVISEDGEVLGALSVSEPKAQMDDDRFRRELPHFVQETASVIEANTAYSSWENVQD